MPCAIVPGWWCDLLQLQLVDAIVPGGEGVHEWGYQWMGKNTGDRNWEDMEKFIPLALNSGTVEVLFLAKGPPALPGSAVCRVGT